MLLCIVNGTDVIMPISCNIFLHWCYCALFMAKILLSHFLFILFFVLVFFLFIFLSHYFIFSSGILNNILSQMCGRLYFPIFLLSVGLFTLMYIDSDCSGQAVVFSSNYFEILYGYFMPTHVLILEYWWWGLQVFLVSFPKCSAWFKIMKNNNFLEILRQNIFPYKPEEAAMFGCKSLSI